MNLTRIGFGVSMNELKRASSYWELSLLVLEFGNYGDIGA
jgi:hypothetical protein